MSSTETTEQKKTSPALTLVIIFAVLVVGTFAIIKLTGGGGTPNVQFEPKIQRYGMVGNFDLIDQEGEVFNQEQVQGKVWVTNFIFTSCATECPLISRRMQEIQKAFQFDDRVQLVSISVDPRTDSPERLKNYAKEFEAGPRWSYVTGEEAEVERLSSKGFKVNTPGALAKATSAPRTRQLLHSQKIAVVDQLGVVRFYANGMNPKASKQVIETVTTLLNAQEENL